MEGAFARGDAILFSYGDLQLTASTNAYGVTEAEGPSILREHGNKS